VQATVAMRVLSAISRFDCSAAPQTPLGTSVNLGGRRGGMGGWNANPNGESAIRDLRNQARIRTRQLAARDGSSTYCARGNLVILYFIESKRLILAERVGFGLLLGVENKELTGIHLPHDPLEPLKSLGRRTYCARRISPDERH
jgi:hypothetical protein